MQQRDLPLEVVLVRKYLHLPALRSARCLQQEQAVYKDH
jgi:hypothetical protein